MVTFKVTNTKKIGVNLRDVPSYHWKQPGEDIDNIAFHIVLNCGLVCRSCLVSKQTTV